MKKKKKKKSSESDSIGSTNTQHKQWRAFAGAPVKFDTVETIRRSGPQNEMSVASLASAALARQKVVDEMSGDPGLDDILADFRATGKWDATKLVGVLSPPKVEKRGPSRRVRRDEDPEGLVSAASCALAAAVWGEAKGVRQFASALVHNEALDHDQRRRADGVARAAGSRKLNIIQLQSLVSLGVAATGSREDSLLDRAGRLVGFQTQPRVIGDPERNITSPRQLLDIRSLEAVLVVVDPPARGAPGGKRKPDFTRVVVLLRDIKGELYLIDPRGLYDPAKGNDDSATFHGRMRKPDEMALRDYLAGSVTTPPVSPIARLSWGGYLSSTPPRVIAAIEISVLQGTAFRYC